MLQICQETVNAIKLNLVADFKNVFAILKKNTLSKESAFSFPLVQQ